MPLKSSSRKRVVFFAVALLLIAAVAFPAALFADPPGDALREAWQRARNTGGYTFSADAVQTLVPRATTAMIGERNQRVEMHFNGDISLPAKANITLQIDGAGFDPTPVQLIQDGARTTILKNGEIIPNENPAGAASLTGDYLAYLAAAENVRQITDSDGATHFVFDVSGAKLAKYVRQQMQTSLDANPAAAGVTVSVSPLLVRMRGQGELWLDSAGLPVRQIINFNLPRADENFDARVEMVINYRFSAVSGQQSTVSGQSSVFGFLPAQNLKLETRNLKQSSINLLIIAVLAIFFVLYFRRKWFYRLVAVTVIASMVLTPALRILGFAQFQAAQAKSQLPIVNEQLTNIQSPITKSETGTTQYAIQNTQNETLSCGDGASGDDTDGDGLADSTENCIGTNPYRADTDNDTITDTLEINGWNINGTLWTTDPFKPDSNDDGLADFVEIPKSEGGNAPDLSDADPWDPDGDGVPNIWDADNDGDGVPDNLDQSPFSVSEYAAALSFASQGGDFGGYEYIEMQIQPQNTDHLRYGVTPLDWPHDERGQLQDLDDLAADLRLTPMLKIRTNAVPNRELAKKYGASYFKNDDNSYTLYAPLLPVADGGNISAFYAKVAYDPAALTDIQWESIEMVWTATFDNDEEINGKIKTTPVVIQTFTEDKIRLTGLTVTKSENVQSAIIGTPHQSDDRYVFNLLLGMSSTFLTHQNPDLDEIENRFSGANTDIAETWGVTSTLIAIDRANYAHSDVNFPETAARISDFLHDNGYATDDAATLIIATQEDAGLFNMDDREKLTVGASVNVKLNNIEMATQRSLQSRSYEYDSGWQALSLADTLDAAHNHSDLSAARAALQADYPDITEDDLRALLDMFYTGWYIGQTRVLTIDAAKLAPENSDDQAVYEKISNAAASLPEYLVRGAHLGKPGGGLKISEKQADVWQYQFDEEDYYKDWGVAAASDAFFDDDFNYRLIGARKSLSALLNVVNAAQCAEWATKGVYHGITGLSKTVKNFGWATRMKFSIRVLGVLGAVANVAIIWVQFGITAANTDNPIVRGYALAYAVAATIVTLMLFAISLFPIGAILVAILIVIDMIVYWATGGKTSILESVIKWLASLFYDVKLLTKINDFDFTNFHTRLRNADAGLVPGARFQIIADFDGAIRRTSRGDRDDLNDSWIWGGYVGKDATGADYARKNGSRDCERDGRYLYCENTAKIEYKFTQAARNVALYFKQIVKAKTMTQKCTLGICYRDDMRINLPADLDSSDRWSGHTIYLDVVPLELDTLWTWSDIENYDPDGDGWNTYRGDVDPNHWDTDGDGLSDKFEFDWGNSDPEVADTDGDGLNDGLEYRLGTKTNDADSDDDGLTDGAEVRHWNGSAWVGGWLVDLPDHAPIRVFSDPLNADADGDGLNDATERDNATSPFAANTAPRLTLAADPTATAPNGDNGVFAEPGTHLTFDISLYNAGLDSVTQRLTLCLPDFLTNAHYPTALSGDRTPATEGTSDCAVGASWNFAADPLLRFERVTATVTADIDPALGASAVATATLNLPYPVVNGDDSIETQVKITADADNPAVTIAAPADGALLGNGTTDYVIGGSASDDSSWIDRVEIDLPAGAGTVTTDENNPWAYTWHLPADGDYTIAARAVDFVGHTATDSISVRVDNTAPTADTDLADGAAISGTAEGDVITVTLTGTANDNLSGLARVQIQTDTAPWRTVWEESGFPTAANWSADWILPNDERAQGEHRVAVRAIDRAGNIGTATERTIVVDVLPPTDELTDRSFSAEPVPYLQAGQPYTFTGSANDVGNAPVAPNPKELIGERGSVADATVWVGLSPLDDNQAGIFAAWVGDFNGDRMADYLIGLPAAENGRGRVTLMSGRAGDFPLPPAAEDLADSRTSFIGTTGAGIGDVILPAGDVNGDGFTDVLIGDSHNGKSFIIFGNARGLGQNLTLADGAPVAWSEIVPSAGGSFGNWLAGAGDVNGDALADILLADAQSGAVYLQLGTAKAWADTIEPAETAAAKINASAGGTPLAIVGDMDGDGKAEFALADGSTVYLFAGDNFAAGNGSPAQTIAFGDAIATFASEMARPAIVPLGDVNGDGLADFVFKNGSAPTLVLGNGGRNFGVQRISRTPAADGFIAAPGDVTGDGLADILLGNSAGDAFLISGADLSGTQATIADVQSGASVPFIGGADLNSDGADDLLLVPSDGARSQNTARSLFGETARINPENLPVTAAENSPVLPVTFAARATASTLTVDDDGCTGCFTDIQSAVDAAGAGDTIAIEAGGYPAFTISGKNNLTVRGVNPDLVFVDGDGGDFAVKLQNANGIRLENLTLRNADSGLVLDDAGTNADSTPANTIIVSRTLIYAVATHAISMDRVSAISVAHSTLAANDTHIGVTGDSDPAFAQSWTTLSTDSRAAAVDGGGIATTADGVWVYSGTGSQIHHYLPQSDSWGASIDDAPRGQNVALNATPNGNLWSFRADPWGGFDGTVETVLYLSDSEIYVGGDFHTAGGNPAEYIARWDGSAWGALNNGTAQPHSTVHAIERYSDGSILVGTDLALLKYDGSWYNLGNTDDGGVYAIAEDTYQNDGDIYVGGTFGSIGGIPTRRIAKLDAGGNWHYVGGQLRAGCNGIATGTGIYDMVISGSDMVVAGQFHSYYASGSGSCGVHSPINIAAVYLSGSNQDTMHYAGNDWDHRLDSHDSVYQIESINSNGDILLAGDIDCAAYHYESGNYYCATPADEMVILNQSTHQFETPAFLKANADVRSFAISGGNLYIGGDFTQVGGGTTANRIARYDGFPNNSGNWHTIGAGMDDGSVHALTESGGKLFAGGTFTRVGGAGALRFSHFDGAVLSHQRLYRYDGSWHERAGVSVGLEAGANLAAADDSTLYALAGDSAAFYRYDTGTDSWTQRADLPVSAGAGASLVWRDGYLYALVGGNSNRFYRYHPATDNWSAMANAPFSIGAGSQLAFTAGDWLYATAGGNGTLFARYHVAHNQWENLSTGDTPSSVTAGGGLSGYGSALFGIPGDDTAELWKFSPVGAQPHKISLENVAFVAPENTATAEWLSVSGESPYDLTRQPDDFAVFGADNVWVGDSGVAWMPNPITDPPLSNSQTETLSAAAMSDTVYHDYHLNDSGLTAGYHTFTVTETVVSVGDSIQAAIDGGARRVIVRPGVYQENITLPSGVELIGSGADNTIIQPPASSADWLISAEGVVHSSVSGLTLDGNGQAVTGIRADDNAEYLLGRRLLIHNTETAIAAADPRTDLELVNLTIVKNTAGISATNCAPIDTRNTIFALNSGTAMAYESCAEPQSHQYNLYWDNGADISPAEPGAAELFLNPLFRNAAADDFRTEDASPVVDAGNPLDPAPPGTGQRVDIGYVEQGRAALYVDDDYCQTCLNDGLSWQVDAFDDVQSALNKAAENLQLYDDPAAANYTIGVGAGDYGAADMPSYVRLIGTDAADVHLAGANFGVRFDGVTHAEVRNATIECTACAAASGIISVTNTSNAITVTRNLIYKDAGTYAVSDAVVFDKQSTGKVTFNTIVDGNNYNRVGATRDGIVSIGTGTWLSARNNIIVSTPNVGFRYGLHTVAGGSIFEDYNSFGGAVTVFYDDTLGEQTLAENDIAAYPLHLFVDAANQDYRLKQGSPAIDAADPVAPVPPGGGYIADMGYWEYREPLAAQATLLLGRFDRSTALGNSGVQQVEFGVSQVSDATTPVTDTLPSVWQTVSLDSAGETQSYWQSAITPTEGYYRLYSRATDAVGNTETDNRTWYTGAFIADGSPPVVTLTLPISGASVTSPLELRAEVSDFNAGAFTVDDFHFSVDGVAHTAEWALEPWDEADGQPRVFHTWLTMTTGAHTVFAAATDFAGNSGQSAPAAITVTAQSPIDILAPMLVVTAPSSSALVSRQTITFAGTVSDTTSGVAGVEVSLDNGITWAVADRGGDNWQYVWQSVGEQDYVSYPAQIRATDRAGNVITAPLTVAVDNVAPLVPPVDFNDPPGTHYDTFADLTIGWGEPLDGSGQAEVLLAVDRFTNTVPVTPTVGYSITVPLDHAGDWYVHIAGKDTMDNQYTRHFGPWHVGSTADIFTAFADRRQTILTDGKIDADDGEWLITEFLDDFERLERDRLSDHHYETDNPVELFTAFAGDALYLGWRGSWWALDGTLWAFYKTNNLIGDVAPPMVPQVAPLPFAANVAVEISSPVTGTLWTFDGTNWHSDPGGLSFAQGDNGDTEARVPINLAAVTDMRMIAFATDPNTDDAWAVFPSANGLDSVWTEAFSWTNVISASLAPYQSQIRGVSLPLESVSTPVGVFGAGDVLTNVLRLTNYETFTVPNVSLVVSSTGILQNQSASGATCTVCPPGASNWTLNFDQIPPGASQIVTLTQQVADTLGATTVATTSVSIQLNETHLPIGNLKLIPQFAVPFTIPLTIDTQPPQITALPPDGSLVAPGTQTLFGAASDGGGGGIARIEYRLGDTDPWQFANGTKFWTGEITVPSGVPTVTLNVRARDIYDNFSLQSVWLKVDATAPTVTLSLPTAPISGTTRVITGTASDALGQVEDVVVQFREDTAEWQAASLAMPGALGYQPWHFNWILPVTDCEAVPMRARATDSVGNQSLPTEWQSVTVDTVAPQVNVHSHSVPVTDTEQIVLSGSILDGCGVSSLMAEISPPTGGVYTRAATITGQNWQVRATFDITGSYAITLTARDMLGNRSQTHTSVTAGHLSLYLPLIFKNYTPVVVNHAPIAVDDAAVTLMDVPVSVDVLANDSDPDGDTLTITWLGMPMSGSASWDATVIYTPTHAFTGTDVFTYAVSDGLLTATATVSVTVNPAQQMYLPLIMR